MQVPPIASIAIGEREGAILCSVCMCMCVCVFVSQEPFFKIESCFKINWLLSR